MIKRSLLAVAVTAISAQTAYAAPFMPMDARGLAMGNTGVASAKLAHAPAYNPSLLSQADAKDDFALLFPQIGVQLTDEESLVDEAEKISDDIIPRFEDVVSKGTNTIDQNIEELNTNLDQFTDLISNASIASDIDEIRSANTDVANSLTKLSNNLDNLDAATSDLTQSLGGISGNPLSAKVGVGGALAIPSKKFAAAISMQGSANISAYANFTKKDMDLLKAYVPAAQEFVTAAQNVTDLTGGLLSATDAESLNNVINNSTLDDLLTTAGGTNGFTSTTKLDGTPVIENGELSEAAQDPNMTSTLHLVAVATVDVGLSFAREFDFGGEKVAIGITPKLQKISTFHYADEIDGFDEVDEDTLKDTQEDYSHFNLDIGASYRFGSGGNWMVGVVGKNLLGGSFDYKAVEVTSQENGVPTTYTVKGGSVSLNPQFRGGLAYQSYWFNAALDVDLMENKPVAFEAPTQFAALGIELDVFKTLQLRMGFRTNLAENGTNVASVGLGFSPFGVHIDIAAMANIDNPETEAGVALETGFYF